MTTRTAKLAADEYLAFDDELPEDAPKLKRLDAAQEGKIAAYIASQAGNPNFSLQQYRDWFRNDLGVTDIEPAYNPDFIEAVRKGDGFSPAIDYGALDSDSMRELQELIAFSGLRPEDAQGYRDLLKNADQATVLDYARSKGMTLDPRDVSAYFDARATGKSAPIPLPIINPGDGRFGAAARGFGDPLGFLDEMGGVVDALGGTDNRESIWNSDRSFGDIYDNNTRQNRAIIDYDETHHPFMRAGGQMASSIALPFGGGVRGVTGFAKAGAIEGGIYGFGSGDGNFAQRLANVPVNAAGGAFGGAVVGKGIDLATPLIRSGAARLGFGRAAPEAGSLASAVVNDTPDLPPGFALDAPDSAARTLGDTVANMDAPDALPALSSPRLRDTIDVNAARTTRMTDGPTEAMINAATARVDPADVLPRRANEVQSLDEAARISEGLYPEVSAPRERDYLEASQYPSRADPDATITRKGPADLVTFTRSLNGIRDEGGELTAAGISNAVRKGEDFAGGENRLGKLVNPEGMGIEEAADRAWRDGYFPELDRPPTNAEFIAALDDTYRGVGRRFRPEDQGQIDAFEGARDQRFAVERARQDGAPLVDDIGQPASLDDIVANTPPASAYDDWNNAVVSKVGNIRVDIVGNLSDKTWLSGLSSLFAALDDPDREAGSFLKRLAGSATVPTGVAQVARTYDPTARETPTIGTAIQARVPGLSADLLPKRDVWGRPMVNEGGVGPDIVSPIWTRTDRNDPVTREALNIGATVSKPQKSGLTPEQFDRLQSVAGPLAHDWLAELMASPAYKAMPAEQKVAAFAKTMAAARKAGKANVLSGAPLPSGVPVGRRGAAPAGLPSGFKVDELPPGFTLDR